MSNIIEQASFQLLYVLVQWAYLVKFAPRMRFSSLRFLKFWRYFSYGLIAFSAIKQLATTSQGSISYAAVFLQVPTDDNAQLCGKFSSYAHCPEKEVILVSLDEERSRT